MVLPALDGAVQGLRGEVRAAVAEVRERVMQDRLPLLSLLQVEPLQMQSAHLSFQEYFAARAICSGKYRLPEGSPPPWQWPAFWANAVTLGSEMGDGFGRGLLRTAGVTGGTLDLSGKLGGDRPTVRIVLAAMMKTTELKNCKLLKNNLDLESSTMLAKMLILGPPPSVERPGVPDLKAALSELDRQIGLKAIKEQAHVLVKLAQINYQREINCEPLHQVPLNRLFLDR